MPFAPTFKPLPPPPPPPGIDPAVWNGMTPQQRSAVSTSIAQGQSPAQAMVGAGLPPPATASSGGGTLTNTTPTATFNASGGATDQGPVPFDANGNPIIPASTPGPTGVVRKGQYVPPGTVVDESAMNTDFGAGDLYAPVQKQAQDLYNASQGLIDYGKTWNPNEGIRDIDQITPDVVKSRDVTIGPLAPVQGVTAPTIGPAAQVGPTTVQRTDLDTGQSDQIRALELQNLEGLRARAEGRAPSAAAALQDAALARIASEQLGAVGTARGSQRAGALLQATRMIGQQGVQSAADKAALAIQEQQGAQQQLTGALAGVRGQDVNIAAKVADLRAQANNLEAQIRSAEAQGNRDAVNQLRSQQAALQLQADSLTAQMTNSRTETEAALRAQTEGQNANRGLTADQINAANRLQAAEEMNRQRIERDKAALEGEQKTFALKGQTVASGIGAGTGATGLTGSAAQGIIGARETAAGQNIQEEALRDADAKKSGINWGGLAGAAAGALAGGALTGFTNPAAMGAGATGGYQIGTGVFGSDERVKEDIHSVAPAQLRDLADKLDAATWRYKNGEGPPGTHAGPMAQDLERSPLGALAVHQDTRGFKQVDPQELSRLALLMSAAALRQRRAA